MRFITLLVFSCHVLLIQAQDSLHIIQVDNLIQQSHDYLANRKLDSALQIILQAEELALIHLQDNPAYYGDACYQHGRIYHAQGLIDTAQAQYMRASTILAKTPGKQSRIYVACRNSLAILYQETKQYEEARELYHEVIELGSQFEGGPKGVASSINNLAIVYQEIGNYEKAEEYYLQAMAIFADTVNMPIQNYASSMNNLAGLYYLQGKNDQAEPLFKSSLEIRRRLFGSNDLGYAETVSNLGNLYGKKEDYSEANRFLEEARKIRIQHLGENHPIVAGSMIDLAQVAAQMGKFEEAERTFIQAWTILEASEISEPMMMFNCRGQLASLYHQTGKYDLAEPLFLKNKESVSKSLGKKHPYYAFSISKLAAFYQSLGNWDKAEPLLLEHRDLMASSFGKEDQEYGKSLTALANFYAEQGQDNQAKPIYEEAVAILKSTLGTANSDYATVINSLATLEYKEKNYPDAESHFQEALISYENALGKTHPFYAGCMGNLANVYIATRKFEQAEPLCLEAKAILEKQYGTEHPKYVFSLQSLATLYERQLRFSEADSLLNLVFHANKSRIAKATSFLSEQELANYIALFESDGNDLFGNAYTRFVSQQERRNLIALAYNHTLYHKGFLLLTARRINGLATKTPASKKIFDQLKSYRQQLAAEYAKPTDLRKNIALLEEKANSAEKELTQLVSTYADAIKQVEWQQIQATLKEGEIAIEFVHFRENAIDRPDSIRYAALLLRPDGLEPTFVSLCQERELDLLIQSDGEKGEDYVNQLYSAQHRGFIIPEDVPSKTLYELVWQPLEDAGMTGVKKIYFSPTRLLHRINLGGIPVDDETVLANKHQFVLLNSTRQLLSNSDTKPSWERKNAVILGAVKFDLVSSEGSGSTGSQLRSGLDPEARKQIGSWPELPATKTEAVKISESLKDSAFAVDLRMDTLANEAFVKSLGTSKEDSPAILHIATHGFFFPDPTLRADGWSTQKSVFVASDQPMMRSGLILAGGNYAWQNGHPLQEGEEDGILTAYEISQMDLSKTNLVILSACETGLGDIKGNEGVYGLQRAFKIAGARYLVMTLWKVSDVHTKEFWTKFYKNWLNTQMTVPDAFRKTQEEMKERFISPYLWAGFVLLE